MMNLRMKTGDHLTDIQLLEYVDGELSNAAMEQASVHLECCDECRVRAERYSLCTYGLQMYRQSALERFGNPPRGFEGFREKLERQRQQAKARKPLRELDLIANWRKRWVVLSVRQPRFANAFWLAPVVVPVLILIFLTVHPGRKVSAKEILIRAENEETRLLAQVKDPVVHMQLSVTSRGKSADWEVWDAANGSHAHRTVVHDDGIAESIESICAGNSFDLSHPLSVNGFVAWRNGIEHQQETVKENQLHQTIEISTESGSVEPGRIHHVAFVLRTTNWHPLEQRIYVNAANGAMDEYDLEEKSYSVVAMNEVPAGIFTATPDVGSRTLTASTSMHDLTNEQKILQSAVLLNEAFHRTGADLREAPEIRITPQGVEYFLWVSDEMRKDKILEATRGVPLVIAHVNFPQQSTSSAAATEFVLPTQQPSYATTPPLTKALWEYTGGVEEANNYLASMRDAERKLFNHASALNRLAVDFPRQRLEQLQPNFQHPIEQIAEDHVSSMHREAKAYFELLDPLLDSMQKREGLDTEREADVASCSDWESIAPEIHEDLPRLQITIQRAFQEDHVDKPIGDLSAKKLLNEAHQLRGKLRKEFTQLCGVTSQH